MCSDPGSAISSHVTLGKLIHLPKLQFLHLQSGIYISYIYLAGNKLSQNLVT